MTEHHESTISTGYHEVMVSITKSQEYKVEFGSEGLESIGKYGYSIFRNY
jgi:hypothetical protein